MTPHGIRAAAGPELSAVCRLRFASRITDTDIAARPDINLPGGLFDPTSCVKRSRQSVFNLP